MDTEDRVDLENVAQMIDYVPCIVAGMEDARQWQLDSADVLSTQTDQHQKVYQTLVVYFNTNFSSLI